MQGLCNGKGTLNPIPLQASELRGRRARGRAMRRFTRLTNAFSKKLANLRAALALHFAHYNFMRVHRTLRVTPAMEAGLTDHVWAWEELVALLT